GVYRRILVLDADILHERGDPARLLAADMRGRAVAAVRDNRQWRNPAKRVPDFRRLGWPAAPYFNAGVVMIDTAAWAAQDLPARCAAFARRHLKGLGRDQALLNGTLRGDWAEISPLWNWQFTWASSHLSGMADPCLIHFIGPAKPWQDRSAGVVPMRWRLPYGAFLAEHFPDAPRPADPDRRHWPARRDLGRSLLRQWRAAGPMLDYLARFSDEYTLVDPR
ncbi:glycosyltransferase, partial [Paracoccus sp. (in: a-proteobacteria)]